MRISTRQTPSHRTCPSQPLITLCPTPPTQNLQACEAKPITPPQSAGVRGSYQCIVDYSHEPFLVTWSGSPEYPDLTKFPVLHNRIDVSSVHQSSAIAAIWRDSDVIDYGSYSSIRITKHDRFPILKLAHSDELSIKLIQHEFNMLAKLTKLGLPVVEFDQQPILDNGIVCGYKMEKLSKLESSELCSRYDDVKQTLNQFHSAGFSHGDFSPSNIMQNGHGRLILIDVSFTGRLGKAVPSFFPSWVYHDGVYSIGADLEQFGKYIVPM